MNTLLSKDIDSMLDANWRSFATPEVVWSQSQQFQRDGMIIIRDIVPSNLRHAVREEVLSLLDRFAERRDLRLATTGNTARRMSVVPSETIAAEGKLISMLYQSEVLKAAVRQLTGRPLLPCPSKDEEFLITRQERVGDTHGWHWGDYSYALIWIIETPPVGYGGMLQCVPHTRWNKSDPKINDYLCQNLIKTYGFTTGDIYLLKTDTTLHRTVPLNRDTTRIILNMTWGSPEDQTKQLAGDDRWWDDANVPAALKMNDSK